MIQIRHSVYGRRLNITRLVLLAMSLMLGLVVWFPEAFLQIALLPRDGYSIQSRDLAANQMQGFPITEIQAHAPGFTVFDNLYWHNHTFHIVTDQPWSIPPIKLIASLSTNTKLPANGRVVAKMLSIRGNPVSPEVKEQNQIGETISMDDAMAVYGSAELIEGPMIINNDDNYYHWIGETFLGAWRVWNNLAFRTGRTLPLIKRVGFTQLYDVADAPIEVLKSHKGTFNDKPGANVWFTEKFFPNVAWDTRAVWNQRADSGKVYRISTAIIADRAAGHSGPSAAFKPWGDVLRLAVSPDWLIKLRNRVLADYRGSTPITMPKKPLVIYLERQDSSRRLFPEDHDALIVALKKLQEDDVADVAIEAFNSTIAFDEQVARIARATILIAVHGNGLTHSLWMTPTPRSAVFEFQPRTCTITDYSPLALAAGLQHYMVHEDNYCKPLDCPKRNCEVSGGINTEIHLIPEVVTDEIRRLLA